MHRHDRFGFSRNRRLDRRDIDVERARIDIDQYRRRARHGNRIGSGDKSQVGNNHFVTVSNPESDQRKINRGRSASDANGEFCINEFCNRAGEFLSHLAVVNVIAGQNLEDAFVFLLAKFRLPPGNSSAHDLFATSSTRWRISSTCASTRSRLRAAIRRIGAPA